MDMKTRIITLTIGDGHTYRVCIKEDGKVVATECKGHWPMTDAETGSSWLNDRLQQAAYGYLEMETASHDPTPLG